MTRGFAGLLGLGAALALGGCGSPHITGRYRSATCVDMRGVQPESCDRDLLDAGVSVVLAPSGIAPVADVRGTGLPERALASYITALAASRLSPSADALRRNLAATVGEPATALLFSDGSAVSGLLTITVSNALRFNPADRIEQASIRLQLDKASFSTWTAAKTAYSEVKPGTITGSREVNLSAGLSASPPAPFPLSLTANGSTVSKREETVTPVLQVEDITVRIEPSQRDREPDTLIVERNGGFGRDLRGNAQIEVAIRLGTLGWMEREVFTVSGYGGASASLQLSSQTRRLLRNQLDGTVTMDYVVRHVVAGGDTSEDGDDRVQFTRRRTEPTRVRLRGATPLYGIVVQTRSSDDFLRVARRARGTFGDSLCFTGREDTERLKKQLDDHRATSLGGRPIGFINGGRFVPLSPTAELIVMSGCGGTPTESEAYGRPAAGGGA